MPRSKPTKKQRVIDAVQSRGWIALGELEWGELTNSLPDISQQTIRDALRAAGVEVSAPWNGVAQHTLQELETCLRELSQVYLENEGLRKYCRQIVIEAKNRARWLSKSERVDRSKRELKAEMAEWMLIWLGDPSLFPTWVELRTRRH